MAYLMLCDIFQLPHFQFCHIQQILCLPDTRLFKVYMTLAVCQLLILLQLLFVRIVIGLQSVHNQIHVL